MLQKKRLFLDAGDQLSLHHSQFYAYFSCLAGIPVINQPTNWQRKPATVLKKTLQTIRQESNQCWNQTQLIGRVFDFFHLLLTVQAASFCLLNLFCFSFCPLWPSAAEMLCFVCFLMKRRWFQQSGCFHFTCSGDVIVRWTIGLVLTPDTWMSPVGINKVLLYSPGVFPSVSVRYKKVGFVNLRSGHNCFLQNTRKSFLGAASNCWGFPGPYLSPSNLHGWSATLLTSNSFSSALHRAAHFLHRFVGIQKVLRFNRLFLSMQIHYNTRRHCL